MDMSLTSEKKIWNATATTVTHHVVPLLEGSLRCVSRSKGIDLATTKERATRQEGA